MSWHICYLCPRSIQPRKEKVTRPPKEDESSCFYSAPSTECRTGKSIATEIAPTRLRACVPKGASLDARRIRGLAQPQHRPRPGPKPPTQIQPRPILQHDLRPTLEHRMHLANPRQVDQGAAVDAQELRGIELRQHVAQGVAVQVADGADVDVQVVAVGADPVDVVDGEDADVFAVAHAEALGVAPGG